MSDESLLQMELDRIVRKGEDVAVLSFDRIIETALRAEVSDVHLAPEADRLAVRFRVDGLLREVASLPAELAETFAGRAKVTARLLSYRTDIPQEGRTVFTIDGCRKELRVSTFPTIHGERVIVKYFGIPSGLLSIEELGMPERAVGALERALLAPQGMVLFTGPAGSGKTTSIYASLKYIRDRCNGGKHIVTIEDPVEMDLDGIGQSQINPYTGFTFEMALRSMLRQDPEVIMIGEVRDRQTAAIAVEAALTGHLVITTVHTGSAVGVFSRLLEMGIEPYLLGAAVTLVMNQRLVRKLCTECRGARCPACYSTGYRHRVLVCEVFEPSDELKEAVLRKAGEDALCRIVKRAGISTLAEEGLRLVEEGITDRKELQRVLTLDTQT